MGSSPTRGTMSEANWDAGERQLIAFRWDEKTAAMCEFALSVAEGQGEHREGRAARNFRQEIYL